MARPESYGTLEQVLEIYAGVWGAAADYEGADYWMDAIDNGDLTYVDTAASFFDQARVQELYQDAEGNPLTGDDFLTELYINIFKVDTPDATGFEYWQGRMEALGVTDYDSAEIGTLVMEMIDGMWANEDTVDTTQKLYQNWITASVQFYDDQKADGFTPFSELDAADQQKFLDAAATLVDSLDENSTQAQIDAAVDTAVAAAGPAGDTFTLTTGVDTFIGTPNNDVGTGTQDTYQTTDSIIDQTTTDADELTITTTASINATPQVRDIETTNFEVTRVGSFVLDAENMVHTTGGQTVTVNRYDPTETLSGAGSVTINNTNAGTFVAGTKVTGFTVDFEDNESLLATVDGREATGDIDITDVAQGGVMVMSGEDQDVDLAELAGEKNTAATIQTAGGVIDVTNGVDDLTINLAESETPPTVEVGLNAINDSLTLGGTGDFALEFTAAVLTGNEVINNVTGDVNLTVNTPGNLDISDVDNVTSIELDGNFGASTILTGDSQTFVTGDSQTGTLDIQADDENFSVTVGALNDITLNDVDFGAGGSDFDAVTFDVTDGAITVGGTINTDSADLLVTGEEDADLGTVTDAGSIRSQTTGDVTLVSQGNAANDQIIETGEGDDTVTVDSAGDEFAVDLGAGDNTLNIDDAADNSQFVMSDGDDDVTVDTAATGNEIALNFGGGTNTLTVAGGAVDATDFTFSGSLDTVDTDNNDLTVTSKQFADFFDGVTYDDDNAGNAGTIVVNGVATETTIDLTIVTPRIGTTGGFQVNSGVGEDTITASDLSDIFNYTADTQYGDVISNFEDSGTDLIHLDASVLFANATVAATTVWALTSGLVSGGAVASATAVQTSGTLTGQQLLGTYANVTAFLADLNNVTMSAGGGNTATASSLASATYVAFGLGAAGTFWVAEVTTGNLVQAGTTVAVNGVTNNDVSTILTGDGMAITDVVLV
ncbi:MULTISPECIES: beta strand repeat-containing protein [Thiorhodovibrio]|uniref:beta strand repeat-containing protein n=1 Tax=Thiorhodovibrio TaxID=61593 RepID=UPI00191458FB|nr:MULTISPECIES: hypothetical protein [Thiorhodovibrio]MBK5969027.1 hypothetical protein [Thiorhodovibrio winogradskyi]WPL15092.1 hypothetical protein Thiosp_04956 [Thiorhodovibrio litoralis]